MIDTARPVRFALTAFRRRFFGWAVVSVYQCSFLRAAVGKVDAGDARRRYLLFPSKAQCGAGTLVRDVFK